MKNVWMTLVLALAAWAIIVAAMVGITHLASAEPAVSRDPAPLHYCPANDGDYYVICWDQGAVL